MIISRQLNYIYFAVPKTATHSVREVLRSFSNVNAEADWEQQALFVKQGEPKQVLPFPEIARLEHGHISVAEIRPVVSDVLWQNAFKFAFVRNPFDRFISVCFFLNRRNDKFKSNALAWMKSAVIHPRFQSRVLVRPQSHQLQDLRQNISLDYIGRYERLQESMNHVASRLGKPSVKLKVKNESDHLRYQSYYDDELKQLVTELYRSDLDLFDYQF